MATMVLAPLAGEFVPCDWIVQALPAVSAAVCVRSEQLRAALVIWQVRAVAANAPRAPVRKVISQVPVPPGAVRTPTRILRQVIAIGTVAISTFASVVLVIPVPPPI